jgi:multidrug transporter EmrE-like cation transporter
MMTSGAYQSRARRAPEIVGAVILASLAFAVGGAFMKASDGFTRPAPSTAVAVLFLSGAVLLAHAVRSHGLQTAYVLGLGLEAVASIGLGHLVFGERLTWTQSFGVVLILAGVTSVRLG